MPSITVCWGNNSPNDEMNGDYDGSNYYPHKEKSKNTMSEKKYIDPKTVKLSDLVKDNKKVRFSHYRDGEFFYTTDDGFTFPVPLDDITGNKVTLLAEDKALLFMRWIRKYIDTFKE